MSHSARSDPASAGYNLRMRFSRGLAVACAVAVFSSTAAAQGDWRQFRGPKAGGVADGARLPERWSATDNVVWSVDVPGRGWSSPIVLGALNDFALTAVVT